MDGKRTLEDIWSECAIQLGQRQPSQDEIIRLMSFLHNSDLLLSGRLPDMREMSERSRKAGRREFASRFRNPLALRFRLFDPERFLNKTAPFVSWAFTWQAAIVWLALATLGLLVALQNIDRIQGSALESVLTANNLALILCIYPVMKMLHELGHAYAVKKWGGEVHEMGIMILVLMPSPYVDASASNAFSNKWRRAIVAGAGIAVEVLLASIAIILWSFLESGIAKAIALNVAIIGSVSTILFNGNPLLRFDGYYMLSDIIESPNLGGRSNGYLIHLIKKHILGMSRLEEPHLAKGERVWFLTYGVAAFIYRMMVMIAISIYIATQYFFIGVALAIYSVFTAVILPLAKGAWFLMSSTELREKRRRAVIAAFSLFLLMTTILFAVPLPYGTVATGVLWIDDEGATIRAGADGLIRKMYFETPTNVDKGALLVSMADPELEARVEVIRRRVDELRIRYSVASATDLVQARIVEEQADQEMARLREAEASLAALRVESGAAGLFAPAISRDLADRFVRRGSLLGFLVGPQDRVVRVVVPHTDIEMVREQTTQIHVRMSHDVNQLHTARLVRDRPDAVESLPSRALSIENGGPIATDPQDPEQLRPLEIVYELVISLDQLELDASMLGQRVYVRFAHFPTPLGHRILRQTRQLFLRHFRV